MANKTRMKIATFISLGISLAFILFVGDYSFGSGHGHGRSLGTERTLLSVSSGGGRKFCDINEQTGECDYEKYGKELAAVAGPGIVLCILSIVGIPVFLIARCCCNLFGGKERSPGVCCGDPKDFKGYSTITNLIFYVSIGLVFVGMFLAALFGFLGDKKLKNGIDDFINTIIDTGENVIDRAANISTTLSNLQYTEDAATQISDFVHTADGYLSTAKSIKSVVDKYDQIRSAAIISSLVLPWFLLTLGVLVGCLLKVRCCSFTSGIFSFLASAIIWTSFAIHITISSVFTDLCNEIDSYLANAEQSNPALDQVINCDNGTNFKSIFDLAAKARNESYYSGCSAYTEICSQTNCNIAGCGTIETFASFKTLAIIVDFDECGGNPCNFHNRTLEDCSNNCVDSDFQTHALLAVANCELLQEYTDVVSDQIEPLLNCSFVQQTFSKLRNVLCSEITDGITGIAIASAFMGVLLVFSTIQLIVGYKRFGRIPESSEIELK